MGGYVMGSELPKGFTLDEPSQELPQGFTLDVKQDVFNKYQAGELDEEKTKIADELNRRGSFRPNLRNTIMDEMAQKIGPMQALSIGAGKGLVDIGRGLGLVEEAGEEEISAMDILEKEYPGSVIAGEIVGQALPFLPFGMGASSLVNIPARIIFSTLVGGAEGGILSKGTGGKFGTGAKIGTAITLAAEIFFPVLGRLGSSLFRRVMKKAPKGAMLDVSGKPTKELQEALDKSGISFEDLSEDATTLIEKQKPGTDPEQVARKALFEEEGVEVTTGELTKDFGQLAEEQRLIESVQDTAAEPLRQFKLKQSEQIKTSLRDNFDFDVDQEGTGQLIHDSLTGQKKLLRTQKNELYETAAENAKEIGGVPIFTDNLREAMPDADLFEDLAITAPQGMESLDKLLTKYGIKDASEEAIGKGFEPTQLTIENFERFRKTLGMIERGDQTGAVAVATRKIKDALDNELAEIGGAFDNMMMTEKQFVDYHKTGDISPSAYGGYETLEGISWLGKPEKYKKILKENKYGDESIIFRQSDDPLKYTKTDDAGKIMRDEKGMGLNLSKSEMIKKGLPLTDTTVVAFNKKGQPIGFASNEFGADGVWVAEEYQKKGIGVELLDELRKQFKPERKMGQSTPAGEELIRSYYNKKYKPQMGKVEEIQKTLKEARKTVRQLKTEFSPQSVIGRVIDTKKDGVTQITEASKIYSKLVGKASPVEETRRMVKSLMKSDKGKEAVASLQASTILDLIDAGFGTESRKISGQKVFNPIAFKRRLNNIGNDKLKAIFANEKGVLKKLNNIEKIAGELIPPSGTQPKGSASVILDLMNTLGLAGISTKIPGGAFLIGSIKAAADPVKKGAAVKRALKAQPEMLRITNMFEETFPGIASAMAIPLAIEGGLNE
jgi:hypothetical protein